MYRPAPIADFLQYCQFILVPKAVYFQLHLNYQQHFQVGHCGCTSTTADSHVLLQAILATLAHIEALPAKDEVTKICADEYTNNYVSIVIHGEEHNEVSDRELEHMEQSTDSLLEDAGSELRGDGRSTGGS